MPDAVPAPMNEEKRTYSRVGTNIQAWLRPLPYPDAPTLFRGEAGSLQSPQVLNDARLSEGLTHFLLDLDRKLELILSLLGREQLLSQFPLTATVCEISGAGLRLVVPEGLPLDELMEVVLVLNQLPLRLAGAVGKARRLQLVEEGRPAQYAFEFTRINEAALDAIIGFVLQEERRRIRERKWDLP